MNPYYAYLKIDKNKYLKNNDYFVFNQLEIIIIGCIDYCDSFGCVAFIPDMEQVGV